MKRYALLIVLVLQVAPWVSAGEPISDSMAREIIEKGIREYWAAIGSDDPQTRIAAVNKFMPDEESITKLFGKRANVLRAPLQEGLKRLRANTDKLKAEFDRTGPIKRVELINVRESDTSGRYKEVLALLPAEVPVFRAVIKYERGTGGSSSYVVVDGRMRWLQGLEEIPKFLREGEKK